MQASKAENQGLKFDLMRADEPSEVSASQDGLEVPREGASPPQTDDAPKSATSIQRKLEGSQKDLDKNVAELEESPLNIGTSKDLETALDESPLV